jgi:hypothetical protein
VKLSRQCQRTVRALVLALMVSTGPVAAAASGATPAATAASASASTCATAWGSVVKHRGHSTTKPVTNVRSGQHRCFDRLVIDLGGTGRGRPGFQAKFVRHVRMDATGADVPLRGRRSHLRAGGLQRAGRRERLPDLPPGRMGRNL